MRRKDVLLVSLLLGIGHASAQDAHDSMSCTECHGLGGVPSAANLRGASDVDVCLRCHDGQSTPDVMRDAPQVFTVGAVDPAQGRSAGALNRLGDREAAGYSEDDGHTMGSTSPPPGFAGTWPAGTQLTCKSCHAVHGNENFRNLGPDPLIRDPAYVALATSLYPARAQPSYALVAPGQTPPPGVDVYVTADGTRMRYDAGAVTYSTNARRNAMNAFCAACHSLMHGEANTVAEGDRAYVRHPTSDVSLSDRTKDALDKLEQPLRVNWRDPSTPEVACLSCHRAHGTRHSFGLVYWDARSAANGEDGAGKGVEGTCRACHAFGAR